MIVGVYSIRDVKQGYLAPTFEINDQVAYRNFTLALSKKDTVFGFQPVDFELYKLGEFDTLKGEFINLGKEVVYEPSVQEG